MTKTTFPRLNTVHSILDTEVNLNSPGVHSPVLRISHVDSLSASDISSSSPDRHCFLEPLSPSFYGDFLHHSKGNWGDMHFNQQESILNLDK